MLKAFVESQRHVTVSFMLVSCVAAIAAIAIGLDGNKPALLLAFTAATSLVLALVHPWRTAREFRYLLYASALGFAVLVMVHNLSEAAATAAANVWPLHAILQGLSEIAFLAALFVCPPALVIGLAGALITFLSARKSVHP